MSWILISSIAIRLAALAWSLVLMRRLGDWRIGLFSAMFGLMALRQSFTLMNRPIDVSQALTWNLNEIPGLIVSILAFLALIFVGRMIGEMRASSHDRESSKPATGMEVQAGTMPSLSLASLGPRMFGPPAVALVLGLGLSWVAFEFVKDWELARADRGFERETINHMTLIERAISDALEAIQSVEALAHVWPDLNREQFRRFNVSEMTDRPGIQALEWIPRVKATERAAYEAAARRDGFLDFTFTERASQGHMVPAAAREEYFPVYFLEPYAGNEAALGFDLASNPLLLEALNRARDTGEVVATARITLVQETGD